MSSTTNKPEEMAAFFDARADGYDEHMAEAVGDVLYELTAAQIDVTVEPIKVLDLGCGTGLEIGPILKRAPKAHITGVDLSTRMLEKLREKYACSMGQITLVQDSYLTMDFDESAYDYAVSVETMHHLFPATKLALYRKICQSLMARGMYIETDYIVSQEKEREFLEQYKEMTRSASSNQDGYYHIDIPFSVETQTSLLLQAGFSVVEVKRQWPNTAILLAKA